MFGFYIPIRHRSVDASGAAGFVQGIGAKKASQILDSHYLVKKIKAGPLLQTFQTLP
jgi:hypothetical protein